MSTSCALVNLRTLAGNIERVRACLPEGLKLLLAAKSDAYGHGVEAVARLAQEVGVDWLGVATVEEGERVRAAGVRLPVLLLGPALPDELRKALALELALPVFDLETARALDRAAAALGKRARVHVLVDTGMGRFGLPPEDAPALLAQLRRLAHLEVEGILSHLAAADSELPEDRAFTQGQIEALKKLVQELPDRLRPPLCHIGNSAGLIQYRELVTAPPFTMIRIGTLLYGYLEVRRPWAEIVHPAATLTARVLALKDLAPGGSVGYGRTHQVTRPTRVAVVAMGYGQGLSPRLSGRGVVWVRGRLAPIVGKICLDHTIVDVTGLEGVQPGEEVEIFGPHLPADQLAERVGLGVCELLVPALRGASVRRYEDGPQRP
ncbi:MAG: Alanine racemase [Acetothermia bacterium 64_32]|nr:MAG: Alanine racemase [Acetothermia bacterium 64_32]HAF71097.1 alanine racemase [Candidatus Acetothermia bacterium]